MEEPTEHESEFMYPPVPEEIPQERSIQRSIISLLLFIIAFYFLFGWDMAYILVLVGVLLVHEVGHYLAMKAFDYKDLSIFFIPFVGAAASGSKDEVSQKQEVIIFLAGPVPGIVIGTICYYFGLTEESQLLIRIANIFIFLNLFNLLPIIPLDGGRILKTLFFESNHVISQVFLVISILLMIGLTIYSGSYFLLIIPFFLYLQINGQNQLKKLKEALREKGIPFDKSYSELTPREYWTTRDELPAYIKFYQRLITPGIYAVSPNENRIIKQIRSILQKPAKKDLGMLGKLLVILIWMMSFVLPILIIAMAYMSLGIDPTIGT